MTNRVAVLVDGDNISASFADHILRCGQRLGRVDVARVYAGANSPSQWLTMAGFRYFHAGTGKNAADLLLTIDAMEMAYRAAPDTFVIASSDGDFSHLALRLREKGHHVCGIGEAKAPFTFRAACSEFVQMKVELTEVARPMPLSQVACSELDRSLRALIAQNSKNRSGMRIADLGVRMHQLHGTSIGDLPEGSWRSYLESRSELFELDAKGPEAMVRFLPKGFASVA